MDTVSLYPQWMPADTPKPYIVQMVEMIATDAPFALRSGSLTLHLWDDSTNADKILEMRNRIMELLENKMFSTSDVNCRCWLYSDGFVTDEPDIWHFVIVFALRIYKSSEAEEIVGG